MCYFKCYTYVKADKLAKYSCPTTFTSSSFIHLYSVIRNGLFCSCCLSFQLDFFSFYNPVPHLDPRCHLDMLYIFVYIFVTKIRWPKGVLRLRGEHT